MFARAVKIISRRQGGQDALRDELQRGGYFDPDWYLSHHPDLHADSKARNDPVTHYLKHGAAEGRNPSPRFHTTWYLKENPDVSRAGINPLVHYVRYGKNEGRRPTPYLGGIRQVVPYLQDAKNYRVIYKTRRSRDLSHEGRVNRLDSAAGLAVWQAFSQEFQNSAVQLSPSDRAYLHNRGFLPDKKHLYGLPSKQVDHYLSDLQARLLPYTNGRSQQILDSKPLQYQLYNRRVPMLGMQESSEVKESTRFKVIVVLDPGRARLTMLAAIANTGRGSAGKGLSRSFWLNVDDGLVKQVARIDQLKPFVYKRRPFAWEAYRFANAWKYSRKNIIEPIMAQSVFSFAQFEIAVTGGGPALVELRGIPCAHLFQVHGPLMISESAIEFIREFGL